MFRTVTKSKLFFLGLLIIGIAIRIYFIFLRKYPTGDEIWVYYLVKKDFSTIWYSSLSDYHAPFYFLALTFFQKLTHIDLGVISVRMISLVFSIFAVYLIWFLVREKYGRKEAVFAYLLSLFSPVFVWSAIFARYYSMLIVITILSIIFFDKFLRGGNIWYLTGLLFLSVLGIYTHYYFIAAVLAFNLFLILNKRKFFIKLLTFDSLVFVLCFPLLYYFLLLPKADFAGRHINDILKIAGALITNITSWEVLLFSYKAGNYWLLFAYFSVIGALFALILYLFIRKNKDYFSRLVLSMFFVPIGIILFYSYLVKPLFSLSSLLIFAPFTIIILSRVLAKSGKLLAVTVSIIIISSLFILFRSSYTYKSLPDDFKVISKEFQKGDLIIHSHIYTYLMGKYYFGDRANFGITSAFSATIYSEEALGYKLITPEELINTKRVWFLNAPWDLRPEASGAKRVLRENFKETKKSLILSAGRFQENDFEVYLYEGKM